MNHYNRNTDSQMVGEYRHLAIYLSWGSDHLHRQVGEQAEKKTDTFNDIAVKGLTRTRENKGIAIFINKSMNAMITERGISVQEVTHKLIDQPLPSPHEPSSVWHIERPIGTEKDMPSLRVARCTPL
ncbi:hypothetical protein E4U45_003887 [Claviceps purpurea]|nr:hypothetical protein E4U45_003887 [Claviceps purpurea]